MKANAPDGLAAIARKEAKILALGGIIPAPWPWAVYDRGGKKYVDVALRLLQLTEMVEAINQFGVAVQREKAQRDDAIAAMIELHK
jgi:hypothetical protein